MNRTEINKSIKFDILQERIKEINKNLCGLRYPMYEIEKYPKTKDKLFNYEIKAIDKVTKEIIFTRILMDEYSTLQYLDGIIHMLRYN